MNLPKLHLNTGWKAHLKPVGIPNGKSDLTEQDSKEYTD
ncbi:MAG: hypothetical protein ACJAZ9_001369 [Neolewinella sp.]|jgi:hypothetical protein